MPSSIPSSVPCRHLIYPGKRPRLGSNEKSQPIRPNPSPEHQLLRISQSRFIRYSRPFVFFRGCARQNRTKMKILQTLTLSISHLRRRVPDTCPVFLRTSGVGGRFPTRDGTKRSARSAFRSVPANAHRLRSCRAMGRVEPCLPAKTGFRVGNRFRVSPQHSNFLVTGYEPSLR